MLFPKLDIDSLVQIDDMTRFDAAKAFYTVDEVISEINIYPDFTNNPATVQNVYIEDCRDLWSLDWAYDTAGEYTVRVELVSAAGSKHKDYIIQAITEEEDNLFSKDEDIYALENELRSYLPAGRNSWKYMHRRAQKEILDWLYRNGKLNTDGTKITKDQILITSELEEWSLYETMLLIYQDLKTSSGEAFNEKLVDYSAKRADAKERYRIRYDDDRSGEVDDDDNSESTRPIFLSR
jgi:polyhydroxyalkanoate synthesis regulator phasin